MLRLRQDGGGPVTADPASPDTPTDPRERAARLICSLDAPTDLPNELRVRRMEARWSNNAGWYFELVDALAAAGLLSLSGDTTREADGEGSLRSRASGTPADRIAEALREYRLTIGPNTRDSIANGMTRVHLSGGERHDIGLIAARALGLEVP